ncbi:MULTISPECIES: hypothetical protein [Rhodonellum]|nr:MULTISPECIES: hypothetical protein [Rhodonellum]MDO9553575.1 hypothetical protein [Rhodonellum sp.]
MAELFERLKGWVESIPSSFEIPVDKGCFKKKIGIVTLYTLPQAQKDAFL